MGRTVLQLKVQDISQPSKTPVALRLALSCLVLFTCFLSVKFANAQHSVDPIQQQLEIVKRAESGGKAQYADALYDLATRYNNRGSLKDAHRYYEESLAVEQTLKRPDKELDVRTQIARTFLFQWDIAEALKKFNEAIAFASSHSVKDGVAGIENNIATSLMQFGRIAEAEEHFKKGLTQIPSSETVLRSTLLRGLASVYQRTGRYDEGAKCLQEATKILSEHGDEGDYGKALVELAEYQNRSGDPAESSKTFETVREKFNGDVYPDVLGFAEFGQAENLYDRQKIKEASEHYQNALKYARANAGDNDLVTKCLIGLGTAEADLEHFTEAEKAHQEALDLADQAGNMTRLIQAEIQLSQDYLIQGNPERALQYLVKALGQTTDVDQKTRGDVLTATARCYAGLGQHAAATKYYQQAIGVFGQINHTELKALALNSLAVLSLDTGDYDTFDKVYQQAKDASSTLPARERAKFEFNDAQSKLMRGRYAEATGIYNEALDKIKNSGDEGLQSSILRGLGTASYLSKDYATALSFYQKALAMSENSGSIETQWDCTLGVGKAYKALNQYKEAEPMLRRAVALVERERSNLTRDSFKTFNLDLRKDCFQELVDLLVRTDRAYESLEIAERGKARAFLDMMANRKERRIASIDIAPVGKPEEKADGQVLIAMANDGSRSVTVSGRDSAVLEETVISPINADPPTIEEIKALVAKRNSTCVEFLMANNHIYTWVVNPNGSIHMTPPLLVSKDFHNRVRDLLVAMTQLTKTPAEMQALGAKRQAELRNLYGLLIKPIEQYLPKDKDSVVTILPHNVLFCIPFAALMADDGEFLIEKHSLSYAPAIGVLRATQKLEEQNGHPQPKLLAFGNPITERIAFLGKLPYAEKEVNSIAKIFGQPNSTVEVGAAATKDKFAELVPNAVEIHLATHGLVDEEHPMRSAVVLAPTDTDDGMLSVRDILTLKNLKARIVVLSACQTGRGKITGDGVVGLSRAFIIAGAPSVLVSQWNVDDLMTGFQMEKFYRFYLKGADRAHALRDAQVATIRYMENVPDGQTVAHEKDKVRANPRYWAAFQLIGEI